MRTSPKKHSTHSTVLQSSHKAPLIISRNKHRITRANISQHALQILYKLRSAGYEAYLVGGSVRDLLLGGKPKDFDIATNARPEKVRQLFKNCRLIGRRFRLAHVFFGREIIEVATFRTSHPEEEHPDARRSETGLLVRDNVYGSLEDDAWRRDFSVNALYYNIADFSVVDYTRGMPDLKNRIIRLLGDPELRYREDPVRMLRAIRFAAKLNFTLDEATEAPIAKMKSLLSHVPSARLFDEVLKLFYCGHASRAFELVRHYGLFEVLFPQTEAVLSHPAKGKYYLHLLQQSCKNTDERLRQNLTLSPAFLFAVLLWPALEQKIKEYMKEGKKSYLAFEQSVNELIYQQIQTVAISRRYTSIVREIWSIQRIMERAPNRRIAWILAQPRFRAAYDFLLLRLWAGEKTLEPVVQKWTDLQEGKILLSDVPPPNITRKRRRKRKLTPPKI